MRASAWRSRHKRSWDRSSSCSMPMRQRQARRAERGSGRRAGAVRRDRRPVMMTARSASRHRLRHVVDDRLREAEEPAGNGGLQPLCELLDEIGLELAARPGVVRPQRDEQLIAIRSVWIRAVVVPPGLRGHFPHLGGLLDEAPNLTGELRRLGERDAGGKFARIQITPSSSCGRNSDRAASRGRTPPRPTPAAVHTHRIGDRPPERALVALITRSGPDSPSRRRAGRGRSRAPGSRHGAASIRRARSDGGAIGVNRRR